MGVWVGGGKGGREGGGLRGRSEGAVSVIPYQPQRSRTGQDQRGQSRRGPQIQLFLVFSMSLFMDPVPADHPQMPCFSCLEFEFGGEEAKRRGGAEGFHPRPVGLRRQTPRAQTVLLQSMLLIICKMMMVSMRTFALVFECLHSRACR